MTYVALALIATIIVMAALFAVRERDHGRVLQGLLEQHRDERSEFINRLQFPKIYQPTPTQQARPRPDVIPNSDLPEMARVGTVILGEPPDDAA